MKERELLDRVVHLLREKAYPADSILVEPSPDAGQEAWLVPDLIVVDPKSKERLAVFEVKLTTSDTIPAIAAGFLETYASTLQDRSVRLYFVTATPPDETDLELYRLGDTGELRRMAEVDFPTFPALLADKFATRKDLARQEHKGTTNSFKSTTSWMAAAAILLATADAIFERVIEFQLLTANRLVLLGIAAALLVAPYAARFKGLGIEWERFLEDRGDDS